METYVDEEEGVHDFSEELDLGVKISTDEAEIVAPSLTETQANSRFLSGDLSASRSPRFSNPTIERQNSFKYRKSARTAPTERSENGTRSQPEVIAAVDPRREYQSGYDEIETRVRSTPPNVPLKKASSPKSPRNPNSTSAGSSPRLSSASHDGPGQHQSPRSETTPHSASRNGNGSAAPLASASQDFPVAPTLAAAPSLSPAPASASAPTGAAPAPKTTRSPVPVSNRESISRRAEPNKRLSGIPAPSPQPTQKSASKPAFSTTSTKSVPVQQRSAPKSASKPTPTTELLSPIRARNFEEALKSATTSTRPVTPSRMSRSTTPTSLRRPQYSLEHLPIHGAVTPTIDGKDWNSSVRVKKPSANQEAAEHLNLIKQDSGEKPLGPRLCRKPSSDSLNRLSSQGQGQADTQSTGAQSRLSTGNGTNTPSSLFSPVSQRKYTATGGPRSQATSRSATPTSQLRPASTSSRPSSRPSSRSTTPTNASNRRGPSLAAYFNDEMTDISAENSQLNGAGGASSVSPRGSTPASASLLSPYNLMVSGPHGTLDSAHLSDADLQSVGKQMLLLKLMLQAKTSADNEKEEADILHAWNVVHAAEEQARLMATQDSGIEEITHVHQQIIDMEAVIDKLNDHLAPAFERLAAYNNAKAEQLASTSPDIVDPLLDAYSPRAHAHKELQARLAGLSRSLAALKRTVDQEDFVAPTAEALASASLSSVSAGEPESALNAEHEQELEREQDRNAENTAVGEVEGEKEGEEGLEQPAEESEVAVEQVESANAQIEGGGERENGENAHVAASTAEEPVIAATASPAPQKVIPSATAVRVRATPARDASAATATPARSTSPAPSVRSASPAPVKRLSINQGPILTSRDAATPKNARMRAPTSTAAPSVPPSQANRAKSPAPAGAAAARGGSSAGHVSVTARTTAASLAGTRSKSPAPATAAAANKHTPTTTGSPRSSTSGASGTSGSSPRSSRMSTGAAAAVASAAASSADVIAHGKEPKFVPRVKKVVEPVEASVDGNVAPASTAEFDNEVEHTTTPTTLTDPLTTDSLEVSAEVVQDEAEEVEEVNEEVRTADKKVDEVVNEAETEELNEVDAELIDETAEDYSAVVPTATTTSTTSAISTATTVLGKVESVEKVDTVPSTTTTSTTPSTTPCTTTTASAAPSTSTTTPSTATSTTNANKYAEIKIPSFRKTPIDLNPYLPTTYTTLTDTDSSVVTAPAEPVTSVDAHLNSMFEMVRLSEDSADEASVKGGSVKESSSGAKDSSSAVIGSSEGSEGTLRPSTPPRVGASSTTTTTTTAANPTASTTANIANTTATNNTTTPSNTTEETTVEASPGKKARGEAFERLMKRLNQNKEAGEGSNTHTPGGSGRTSPSTTVPLPLSLGEESSVGSVVGSVVGSGAGVASSPVSKSTASADATSTTNMVPGTPATSTASVSVFNSPEPTNTTTASTATPSNTSTTNTTTNDTSTEETITRRPSVAEMLAKFGGKATSSPVPNRAPSPVTTTSNTPFNATNTTNTPNTTSGANVLSVDTTSSGAGSTPVSPSNKVVSPTNTSANNTTPNGGLKRVQSTRVSELMNKFGGSRKDLLVPTPSPTVYSVGTSGTSGATGSNASVSGGVSGGSGSRRGSVQAIGSITPKKAVYENTETSTTNTTNAANATSPTNNTSRAKSPSYRASSGTKSPGSLSPHNSAYNLTTTTTTSPKSSVSVGSATKSPRNDKSPLRSPTNTTNTTTSPSGALSPVNRTSTTGSGSASPKRGSVSSVSPTNKQGTNISTSANTSASANASTGLKSIPSFTSTNVISTVSSAGATPTCTSPLSKDSGVLKSSPSFNSAFTVPATTSNTVDSNTANTATANSSNDSTRNTSDQSSTANTTNVADTASTSTTANVTVNATSAPHVVQESSVGKSTVGSVVSNKDIVAEQNLPSYEEAVSNTASTTTGISKAATTVPATAGARVDLTTIGESVVLEGASASTSASSVIAEAGLPTYEEATINTTASSTSAVEEAPPSYEQAVDHTTSTSNTTVTGTIPANTTTTTNTASTTTNTATPVDTSASTANTTSTTSNAAYTVPPAITITPVSEHVSVPTTHTTHAVSTTPTHSTPTNLHSTSKDGVAAVDYTNTTNTTNTSTSGTARTPPSAAPRSRTTSGLIQKTGSGGVSTPNNANTTTANTTANTTNTTNTTTANTTGSPRSTTLHSSSAESEGSAEWGTGWEMSASQDVNDGYLSRALSLDPDSPRSSNGNRPGTAHSYGSSNNSGVYSNNHSLNVSHSDEFIRVRDASHLATVREGLSENDNEAEEEVQISNTSGTSGVSGSSNVQGVQSEVDLADEVSAKLTAHWVASKSAENVYGTSGNGNDRGMYVNVDHDADISTIGSLSDDRTVHSVNSGVYVGGAGGSSNVNNANSTNHNTHTTHTTHAYPTTTYAHGQPSPAAQQHTSTFHTTNNTNPNHTTYPTESGPNTPLTPNTPYTPSTPLTSVVNVSHKDDTSAGASVSGEQENEYEGSDAGSIAGSTASKKKRRPTLKGLWKRMGVN